MAPNSAADSESTTEHPASGLDTVVVGVDDVVEVFRRDRRDETKQRNHVLRISPPFEGEQPATPHSSETHTYYPPEMNTTPIHLGPGAFVVGHSRGARHSDWRNEWNYPDLHEERSLFRNEIDAFNDNGGYRELTDDEEAEWDEWWETVVDMWEDRVRHALEKTEELTFASQYPDVESATVSVRVED